MRSGRHYHRALMCEIKGGHYLISGQVALTVTLLRRAREYGPLQCIMAKVLEYK